MIRKHPGRGSARTSFVKILAVAAVLVASVVAAPAAGATTGLQTQSLSGTLTPTDLASALVGSGVTISNVQYTGANDAAGTFSGGGTGPGSIIGFDQGVVLSSGSISNVVGPNSSDSISTANGQPGDADLNGLLPPGQSTQDAAALSFDFVANASSISFSYVFASDEYNEYVNSGFNDVFGFFVNGNTLSADCATVGGQPVSVDTINGGHPFGTGASHPELYRNNSLNDPGPATINTEMDGLTTVLLCQAPVIANQTNTMKLAISDVGDQNYDSNVFIEAGSLTTAPPIATPTNVTGYPSNASAIVTWSFSQSTPVDSFEVVCTATGNPENTVTVSVPGTQTNATVGGLTNGTEYTCAVRAHSGGSTGSYSAPSPPFTPSDGSNSKFIDPSIGGKVNLTPVQSFVGTTGQLVLPAQPSTAPAAAVAATSSNSVVVSASLFGSPGQVDPSCGGNTCVGQGINWTISNLNAFAMVKVVFNEDPSITNGGKVNKANVYLNDVLLPNCSRTLKINCVGDRDTTTNGGWKVTIKVDGHLDPHGRL